MDRVVGVSVVVAAMNGESHIAQQLDSIDRQTVKPVEIVIGDDRSQDATLEVIRRFQGRTDIPLTLIVNPERLGYAENFLQTALTARGTLIAFADQDDVWLPDKIEAASAAFEADKQLAMWVSGWTFVDAALNPLPDHRFHTGIAQRSLLAYPMHVPHGARTVFRADLLEHLPPHDRPHSVFGSQPAHHDEWVFAAAHVLGKVATDPKPRMLYRRHDSTVSGVIDAAPTRQRILGLGVNEFGSDFVDAAADRARYLHERADKPSSSAIRTQLKSAARYYDQLVPRLIRRAATDAAATRGARIGRLAKAFAHGDYKPLARGGLGTWLCLQDSYRAVRNIHEVPLRQAIAP